MKKMIAGADTVIAIPYIPKRIGYTGDTHFAAADYMCKMAHGLEKYNVVKWSVEHEEVASIDTIEAK